MPYAIRQEGTSIVLELAGEVTARDVAQLAKDVGSVLKTQSTVLVRAGAVEDVDTSVLQMLVSLRKTTPAFTVEDCSPAFDGAVDRCGLRRELLGRSREAL
jgi:anti-anti-sigma regulatory factor